MNKKENIPQGVYSGHLVHFPNQAECVFTFIIDEAENDEMIGKGIPQRITHDTRKRED